MVDHPVGTNVPPDLAFGKDGSPRFPFEGEVGSGASEAVIGTIGNTGVKSKVAVMEPMVKVGMADACKVEARATVGDAFTLQWLA